jgi:hypothetical protein
MNNFEDISTVSELIDRPENVSSDTAAHLENQISIERHPQTGFDPEQLVPTKTYVECGVEKLTALCESVGLNHKTDQIIKIFRSITTSWGDKKVGDTTWQSDVSDDAAPFEFSIALDPDNVELRVLVEAQGSAASLQSNWQAGLELNQYLAANYSVNLDRFEQIADLYAPTNSTAKFSIWHAVCFYPDKEPAFKLYLNPQSQSQSRSAAIVEESLVRLGFTHAWPTLAETSAQRGPDKDEFVYFSLDLAAHAQARVKVYLRHHDATPAELESALSAARNYVSGDAIEFCQAMAPGQTSFSAKSAISAFSWIEGDNATPSSGTLHLPISNYANDDRVVCDRLDLYFIQYGLPVSRYQSAIQSLAIRPLEAGVGMHSYTSFRREQQQRRVTLYLNPEVHTVRAPRTVVANAQPIRSLQSLEEMVCYYKTNSVEEHPFFQRLHREPVNLTNLWLLFANFQEGIVDNFTRRLALVVAYIDDEYIRCILAHQLNEELGNGDVSKIHRKIFDRLTLTLESYKPHHPTAEMLSPGSKLSQELEILYSANPYVGVGAAIMMEIRGEQRDEIVNQELMRTALDSSVLAWFYMHGELEADHADEVLQLSRQIDNNNLDRDKATVLQGLELTSAALWTFCNGMYRVCFT